MATSGCASYYFLLHDAQPKRSCSVFLFQAREVSGNWQEVNSSGPHRKQPSILSQKGAQKGFFILRRVHEVYLVMALAMNQPTCQVNVIELPSKMLNMGKLLLV